MDLAPPRGAPIYAFADGIVIASQDTGVSGFGGWIVVLHEIDGREMSTVYGHQDPGGNLVAEGATVEAGEHIARVGNSGYSTGPHLHFELYEGNRLAGERPLTPHRGSSGHELARPPPRTTAATRARTRTPRARARSRGPSRTATLVAPTLRRSATCERPRSSTWASNAMSPK
ncbi:M23 family metallopeptidase [Dietzia aerolata]|uniref:M23 family metallopeptidase n=1 Tax=Dietzia aerolata TaxID=595984 RepID=UPI003629A49D